MIYNDSVYGKVKIEEKVILDLIDSKAMQRLRGIFMGPVRFLNKSHFLKNNKTTRFDHSIGVYILLTKFNVPIEEQVAGLLHDISHTTFSHSVDFLFNKNLEQDFHEEFYEKIIRQSDVPRILKKNNIDLENILDEKKFTLLEKKLPDICADRVDYFLRDMIRYDPIIKKNVNKILNSITDFNHEMVFNDATMARIFAEKYIELNKMIYCNPFQSALFKLISDVLRMAIQKKIINELDLFTTDEKVLNKLKKSKNKDVSDILNKISNLNVIEDEKNYDYYLKSKVRCTDPKILIDNKIVRLSKINESYKRMMDEYVSKYSDGFFIRVL